MNDHKINIKIAQEAALSGQAGRGNYLSNTPYYIDALERKIGRLEYKIDLLISEMNKNKGGAA